MWLSGACAQKALIFIWTCMSPAREFENQALSSALVASCPHYDSWHATMGCCGARCGGGIMQIFNLTEKMPSNRNSLSGAHLQTDKSMWSQDAMVSSEDYTTL